MQLRDRWRLKKILEYCNDIQATVLRLGTSVESFLSSRDFQYSVSFCILQIGELVGALTEEYRELTKNQIRWHEIKAMRNVVVHAYGSINLEIVWEVATADIPRLGQFCKEQLQEA